MISQAEIHDSAHSIIGNARKLFKNATHKAHDAAQFAGKRFRKIYPVAIDTAHTGAQKALRHAHHYTLPASYRVKGLKMRLGRDLRLIESFLVHVGLGYIVVKLYNAYESEPASASAKIKAHIHEKPVESVCIALGVGYLLGKIFR